MSPALLLAAALETALNRYLRLDEEIQAKTATLADKTVAIELLGLNFTLYLLFGPDSVHITEQYDDKPDVRIRAAPFTLARLVGQGGARNALDGIEVEGDMHLALALQKLLANIDIDGEEVASHYLGDTAARKLGVALRDIRTWGRRARDTLLQDIAEYLQEESRDIPSRFAVERFLDEVDKLRSDADRLQARIERLQQRRHQDSVDND